MSLFTLIAPSESLEASPNRYSLDTTCEGELENAIGLGVPITIGKEDVRGEGAPKNVAGLRREDDLEEDRADSNESSASSDKPCT